MSALLLLAALAANPAAPAPRCTVQQVHTPAGKMIHAAPIVRCADKQEARQVERRPASAGGAERGAR